MGLISTIGISGKTVFTKSSFLSASFHGVSVLSIDNEKEVFFHSDPTSVAEEKESIIDKIIELLKKAFSTRSYLDKLDRKHEMFLMVHMAKADGIVEDAEKRYLSNAITGLKGFTKKEKAELFNLMSSSTFPPILPLNSYFSSKERAEEAKKKIIELVAKADGEYEPVVKEKIEEINKAIEQGFIEKPSKIGRFFKTWQISVTLILLLISGSVGLYIKLTTPTENNLIVTENKNEDNKDSTGSEKITTEPTKAEEKPEKTKPETISSNETQKWLSYNFYGNNMTEYIEKNGKKFYYFTSNNASRKEMTILSEATVEGTSIINVQLGSDVYILNISGNSLSCVDSQGKPQVYNFVK